MALDDLPRWIVCRDVVGRWCVEHTGSWPCRVCLGDNPLPGDERRTYERARDLAAALNRIYAP